MQFLPLICIPVIATIVYWVIELIKYTTNNNEKFKRFIPLTAALLGAILGVGSFYLAPDVVPATNVLVALILGASSGLTAVGVNQTIKQLGKKDEDNGTK